MRWMILAAVLLVVGCATSGINKNKIEVASIQKDAHSYAVASCYAFLPNPFLKSQGDAFASVILQRSQLHPNDLAGLISAVKQYMLNTNEAVTRVEREGAEDKSVPVLFCSEVIYDDKVAMEIERLVAIHKPAKTQVN